LAPQAVLVAYLAAKIRAETEQPDISGVMSDVEALLNDSIATEGYHMPAAGEPEALVNLSEFDFDALKERFNKGHKYTEVERLKRLIEGKLTVMVRQNHSRVDLAEKFERLIEEYNAGSANIEELFKELVKLSRELSEEEKRAVAEGLSEEELALFDILTKPEPKLSKKEEAAVKAAFAHVFDAYTGAGQSVCQ
jgi:type I restriction enzyme R subunit